MGGPKSTDRKFRKELNSGVGALLMLGLFAHADTPLYGYQVAKQLEALNDGPLPMRPGALYPVLRSLEAKGLLSSNVEPSVTGPPRRYYRITAEGRRALAEWRETWNGTRTLVERVLSGGAS